MIDFADQCEVVFVVIVHSFLFHGAPTTHIYTLSLRDALPICAVRRLTVHFAPLLDNGAAVAGTSVTFIDVTGEGVLRTELERAKQEVETAYEELQSSNEELETTNEELQSTVEELETTNEELQSTNEELETMNEELESTN